MIFQGQRDGQTKCRPGGTNLDSGAFRNKDFPDAVEAVEVWLGEPGRQDGSNSLGQVASARDCGRDTEHGWKSPVSQPPVWVCVRLFFIF